MLFRSLATNSDITTSYTFISFLLSLIQLYPIISHLVNLFLVPCCLFHSSRLVQPEVMSMRHSVAPANKKLVGGSHPKKKKKNLELAACLLVHFIFYWGCGPLVQGPLELFFYNVCNDWMFMVHEIINSFPVCLVG